MGDGLDFGRVSFGYRTEPEGRLNDQSRIGPQDRLFAVLLNPLIPKWVRPNHVTIFRFAMIPIVVFALAVGSYEVAVPLFVLLSLSDTIDGSLARVRGQVTEWGIVFDSVSDKALVLSVALAVMMREANSRMLAAVVVAESLVVLNAWCLRRKGTLKRANFFGKLKMFCEAVGLSALLLDIWLVVPGLHRLAQVSIATAVFAALISLIWRRKDVI